MISLKGITSLVSSQISTITLFICHGSGDKDRKGGFDLSPSGAPGWRDTPTMGKKGGVAGALGLWTKERCAQSAMSYRIYAYKINMK